MEEKKIEHIFEALEEFYDEFTRRLTKLGERVDALGERVDALGERVDALGEKSDEFKEFTNRACGRMDAISSSITVIRSDSYVNPSGVRIGYRKASDGRPLNSAYFR